VLLCYDDEVRFLPCTTLLGLQQVRSLADVSDRARMSRHWLAVQHVCEPGGWEFPSSKVLHCKENPSGSDFNQSITSGDCEARALRGGADLKISHSPRASRVVKQRWNVSLLFLFFIPLTAIINWHQLKLESRSARVAISTRRVN
jgi:hypothetical protein